MDTLPAGWYKILALHGKDVKSEQGQRHDQQQDNAQSNVGRVKSRIAFDVLQNKAWHRKLCDQIRGNTDVKHRHNKHEKQNCQIVSGVKNADSLPESGGRQRDQLYLPTVPALVETQNQHCDLKKTVERQQQQQNKNR